MNKWAPRWRRCQTAVNAQSPACCVRPAGTETQVAGRTARGINKLHMAGQSESRCWNGSTSRARARAQSLFCQHVANTRPTRLRRVRAPFVCTRDRRLRRVSRFCRYAGARGKSPSTSALAATRLTATGTATRCAAGSALGLCVPNSPRDFSPRSATMRSAPSRSFNSTSQITSH